MLKALQPALQIHPSYFCVIHQCYREYWLPVKFSMFLPIFLKELASALKSALSGHLETVILGLLKTPAQYDASELKASMKVNTCEMQTVKSTINICELQLSECN